MKEKAAYEAVAALMGFALERGHEELLIEEEIHDHVLSTNPSSQDNAEAAGNHWKAIPGSEAWRDFRRSRRRMLRGSLSEGRLSITEEPFFAKKTFKDIIDIDTFTKADLPMNEVKSKTIPENTSIDNENPKSGASLAERLPDKILSVKFSDTDEYASTTNFLQTGIDDVPQLPILRETSSSFKDFVPSPTTLRQTSSAFDAAFLTGEIESLELLFDQQEDEIDELEDELARSKKKSRTLLDDLDKKGRARSHLENELSMRKVDLANSQEGESDLQLEMSRLVMVRDLENINMINAFNNLYLDVNALENDNATVMEKFEHVKKRTTEKETELLHALNQVIELKRERAQESFSRPRLPADHSITFSYDLKLSVEDTQYDLSD